MDSLHPPIAWLNSADPFPDVSQAWGLKSDAPGLLAAGGDLLVSTLCRAYSQGIFPWFSQGQPILWWSPDPRMVLEVDNFQLHRSLRKTLANFRNSVGCEIRFDTAFTQVIEACANTPRRGQPGTWILPDMVAAYTKLHEAGYAHSIETWVNDELVGGLYCTALGKAVFGESMFARVPDASKIALAALVAFCREMDIELIDCQQNTAHLASLGATEIPRNRFLARIMEHQKLTPGEWVFTPLYWLHIL